MAGPFKTLGDKVRFRENLVLILSLLGGLYLFLGGNRGMWNFYKLHQEKVQLEKEVAGLRAGIDRGRSEYQTYANDPRVIEKQAREELNLVKPGETIYRFSGDNPSR